MPNLGDKCGSNKIVNQTYATIGWGISFMVGPITLGLSAVGTGLILLGINAARRFMGIPTNRSNTGWGITLMLWGTLDYVLHLSFENSAAVLLIIIGVVTIGSLLLRPRAE